MKIVDISTKFARKIVEKALNNFLRKKLISNTIKLQLKDFSIMDLGDESGDVSIELNGKLTMSKEEFAVLMANILL